MHLVLLASSSDAWRYALAVFLLLTGIGLCFALVRAGMTLGRVNMVLDVPRSQYYLYTLDGALNGFITPEQCLAWFEEVDARSRRVRK